MKTPEKPKRQSLAERIATFWEEPSAKQPAKRTDEGLAKAVAKLTELLGRLWPKK
jgi:hypothetical protein